MRLYQAKMQAVLEDHFGVVRHGLGTAEEVGAQVRAFLAGEGMDARWALEHGLVQAAGFYVMKRHPHATPPAVVVASCTVEGAAKAEQEAARWRPAPAPTKVVVHSRKRTAQGVSLFTCC
jgi:hypothetical protein